MDRSAHRVIAVDDDPFTCSAVSAMLLGAGFVSVATYRSAAEAIAEVEHVDPTVAVVDLDLGEGPNGVDLVEVLRRHRPGLGVVFLSTYETARLLGVSSSRMPRDVAFVVKSTVSTPEVLAMAVERCLAGGQHAEDVVSNSPEASGALSDAHLEVLRLLAQGYTNAEIAVRLVVSERTIEKSIARLIKVMGIAADKTQNQRVMLAQAYLMMSGVMRRSS
jgi:DNA-binding NarL/FixJ family response regulator